MFFENQLELAKNNLAAAEISLKRALDTHGLISVDADSRALVESVSQLRAKISAKEIQLNSMTAFVTSNNQEYRRVQEELSSLKSELSKIENGRSGALAGGNSNREGLNNIKIVRDVKYYQMLYELLAKQYEVARLDEANDSAVIQVLDPALVPERKFGPKRAIIIVLAGLLALGSAIAWAFLSEGRERMARSPERSARMAELKSYLSLKRSVKGDSSR
jgi:tyrosine-protein kinase Etk/Wzc